MGWQVVQVVAAELLMSAAGGVFGRGKQAGRERWLAVQPE
jgi:hypothetical protein